MSVHPRSVSSADAASEGVGAHTKVLLAAADLLEPEGAWTQGAFARAKNGNPIGSREPYATCWCAVGAIYRVSDELRLANHRAIELLAEQVGYQNVGTWNDNPYRTQAEVVAALRAAATGMGADFSGGRTDGEGVRDEP